MTRAKVCGLTTERDRRAAVGAGADAVGFLADVPVDSPREVPIERAADLAAATPPFVASVLVTMPETPERATELVDRVGPDAVQLHGDLPPADVARVADSTDVAVLKAVAAADRDAARYDDAADALLVDSADADGAGGTGRTHDWDADREFAAGVESPVVLAGGLTPANVADAIAAVDPFAVDVASGVEAADGEKDHGGVRRFVAEAHRATAVVES